MPMTQTLTLFTALENVLKLRNAERRNEFFSLGTVSSEERGHTFGKVVGIEEAIAQHAVYVKNQSIFENMIFNSVIQDDRSSSQPSNEVTLNSIVTVESDEFGKEVFGIDVSMEDDDQQISSNSPFAIALIGRQKGAKIRLNNITYRILSVRSTQNREGILQRIEKMVSAIIQDANEILSSVNAASQISTGMLTDNRNLTVANLLDKIEMVQVMCDLYGVDFEQYLELMNINSKLSSELSIKRNSLRSSTGFIHVMIEIRHDVEFSTRIGKLHFKNNYPTAETVIKLQDELLFQAAVQVYLWSIPIMDVVAVRDGHHAAGVNNAGIPIYENFLTPKTVVPTGNQETIYAYSVVTLGEEPMVLESVPGVLGFIADAWQRPIEDAGLTGPDEGKGGKFLLVPPGYKGDLPQKGYFVTRSHTRNVWWLLRGFVQDGKTELAIQALKQVRLYPLSKVDAPPQQQYVNLSEIPTYCIPPRGFEYWEKLAIVLQEEPVQERDRIMMGMAASIGIEKGKPFKPESRTRAILVEAEEVAWAMSTALAFASSLPAAKAYDDRQWEYCFLTKSPVFETESYLELYQRSAFTYQAMTGARSMVVSKVGAGSQYLTTFRDTDSNYLDGSKSYKLNVPADPPVNQFWSVAVYDTETRSLIDTGRPSSTRNSNMDLNRNEDGSIDLYFGPAKPPEGEANWVKTLPGKGFYLYFRFYGPLQPYFDKTWKPGDLVQVK